MSDLRRARTETFDHTITGLLTKRAHMFQEAERIRDRLAEIRNEVAVCAKRWAIRLGVTQQNDHTASRHVHKKSF